MRGQVGLPKNATPILPKPTTNGKAKTKPEAVLFETEPVAGSEVEIESPEVEETPEEDSGSKPKRGARIPKIATIDLKVGNPAFREYATEKAPVNIGDRYVIIAKWLKENGIEPVTGDHVYTCYRWMGWANYPRDWNTAFNNGIKKGHFDKATGRGEFRINHVGEDYANQFVGTKA